MPGRFKDYIAMPKPNMYQSLHTTVVGPSGDPLEIQIRTWEMHRTSEYGIAAHWRYKEGGKVDQFENKLSWLRALLEWQKDMRDSRVFMENLKLDLFDSQVFVFSPRGDVFSMPAGGTPLDFAYSGAHRRRQSLRRRQGQRADRAARLRSCKNGDICEILVNKTSGRPSLDWLSIVKTSSAKHKIKQWFRKERREENVLAGQEALEHELARAGVRVDAARGELLERIATRMNYATPTDLYAAIGFGDASAQAVANRLRDEVKSGQRRRSHQDRPQTGGAHAACAQVERRADRRRRRRAGAALEVLLAGAGRSDHRLRHDRPRRQRASRRLPERRVHERDAGAHPASAVDGADAELTHAVDVEVEAEDRPQLLQDIMAVFAELKTQVSSVTARVRRDGLAVTSLTVQIRDLDHLHKILTKLETLEERSPRLSRDQARARRAVSEASLTIRADRAAVRRGVRRRGDEQRRGRRQLSLVSGAAVCGRARRFRPTRRTTPRCGSERSAARAGTAKRSPRTADMLLPVDRGERRRLAASARIAAAAHAAALFERLIPWLLLFATSSLPLSPLLTRRSGAPATRALADRGAVFRRDLRRLFRRRAWAS